MSCQALWVFFYTRMSIIWFTTFHSHWYVQRKHIYSVNLDASLLFCRQIQEPEYVLQSLMGLSYTRWALFELLVFILTGLTKEITQTWLS